MRTPNPSKPHPTIVASADLHLAHHYRCAQCQREDTAAKRKAAA